MKQIEFRTIKGDFLAMDIQNEYSDLYDITHEYGFISSVENISEEDASQVVVARVSKSINTHLLELHSLLKSKGIDINKGNWYLFKKI